jgi:hypothetical protein
MLIAPSTKHDRRADLMGRPEVCPLYVPTPSESAEMAHFERNPVFGGALSRSDR